MASFPDTRPRGLSKKVGTTLTCSCSIFIWICVVTFISILLLDEELFADYGYDLRIKYLPLWYYQSYMKEVGMLPHDVRPNHVFVRSVQMYKTG